MANLRLPTYRIATAAASQMPVALPNIIRFYEKHEDVGISPRDPRVIMNSIEKSGVFTVTNDFGLMVGASMNFYYGDRPRYVESGATRVIHNGLGLQEILIRCKLCQAYFYTPPAAFMFAVAFDWNKGSIHVIEKCGFTRFTQAGDFLSEIGIDATHPAVSQAIFFKFDFSDNKIAEVIKALLHLYENPEVVNKKTGARAIIRLELALFEIDSLRKLLQTLAA